MSSKKLSIEQEIELWSNLIEDFFRYCENCNENEPNTEAERFWPVGDKTTFQDLLTSFQIVPEIHQEIAQNTICPNCTGAMTLETMIELPSKQEDDFYDEQKKATKAARPKLAKFEDFLNKYPYLGASHRIGKQIIREIRDMPFKQIENEIWYRSRCFSTETAISHKEMLPPNQNKIVIGEGRFNHFGQSHYYLGDSELLCRKEICQRKEDICYAQKIRIRIVKNVLDLSRTINPSTFKVVPYTFAGAIYEGVLSKESSPYGWKPEYFVTRYIGDVCKSVGVNGIIYQSSTGFGCNLVVFDVNKMDFDFVGKPQRVEEIDSIAYEDDIPF